MKVLAEIENVQICGCKLFIEIEYKKEKDLVIKKAEIEERFRQILNEQKKFSL